MGTAPLRVDVNVLGRYRSRLGKALKGDRPALIVRSEMQVEERAQAGAAWQKNLAGLPSACGWLSHPGPGDRRAPKASIVLLQVIFSQRWTVC